MTEKQVVLNDIETYHDYVLFNFERYEDRKRISIEMSSRTDRAEDDAKRAKVRSILRQNRIITYNGQGYDLPLMWYFVCGATNEELKRASDQIIVGRVKYWEIENLLGISIPREIEMWDLMEPQPNAWASLKTLNGRLHGKKMQDLPIEPSAILSHADMDLLTEYCWNDIDALRLLYDALQEPMALRKALSEEHGANFMSRSDSQLGEGIIKRRVKDATGNWPEKVNTPAGSTFPYMVPDWMSFEHTELAGIVERLHKTEFFVQANGKVELPEWLNGKQIEIGGTTYAVGIGGLHSTERNRAVYTDDVVFLRDFDVQSYYPSIILGSGLYPKACGPAFLDVYRAIREERLKAKREGNKVADQGYKIALNGVFGKLGSPYSVLYAPHLLIAVTLTGQLALLMLIERAERAGIPVVSANTDGVVFQCPRELEGCLTQITQQWERDTGFDLEATDYEALYSQSVNTYIAVKPGGKAKRKGVLANPRAEGDLRTQLMNNPSMNVCADAATAFLARGVPIEETIYGCKDVRDFVTVVNVRGGGTWRDEYLGKVVRFVWSTDGDPIFYKDPHPETGNYKKVSKTDGCRPLMELPDDYSLPADIDFDRYIEAARQILVDVGFRPRAAAAPKVRVFKYSRQGWLVASLMAA